MKRLLTIFILIFLIFPASAITITPTGDTHVVIAPGTEYNFSFTVDFAQLDSWSSYPAIVAGLGDVGEASTPNAFEIGGTQYLISGRSLGTFAGYKWNGASWDSYPSIASGLGDIGASSSAYVFYIGSDTYLIAGQSAGGFFGYKWNGTSWNSYPSIVSGLVGVGGYSTTTVFYIGSDTYLIAGEFDGVFTGYKWNGTSWNSYPAIVSGLVDVGLQSSPDVFEIGGTMYLVSGEYDGVFTGYKWNGTSWNSYPAIVSGLVDVGASSTPTVFEISSTMYLVSGEFDGDFNGYIGVSLTDEAVFYLDGAPSTESTTYKNYLFSDQGEYHNVSVVGHSGAITSNMITYNVLVQRTLASTPIETFNETEYNLITEHISDEDYEGLMDDSTKPFIYILGRLFYLILFVLPYGLMWMKQQSLTIPVVLSLFLGSLFIGFVPEQYKNVILIAIALSYGYNLYMITRER